MSAFLGFSKNHVGRKKVIQTGKLNFESDWKNDFIHMEDRYCNLIHPKMHSK